MKLIDSTSLAIQFLNTTGADPAICPLLIRAFEVDWNLAADTRSLLNGIKIARQARSMAVEVPLAMVKPTLLLALDNDGTVMDDTANAYAKSKGIDVSDLIKSYQEKDRQGSEVDNSFISTMIEKSQALPEGKRFTESCMKSFSEKMPAYPGAEEFIPRLKGEFLQTESDYNLRALLLSTGLDTLVVNTKVAKTFDDVLVTKMSFNERNELHRPLRGISTFGKSSYLYASQKGIMARELDEIFKEGDPRGHSAVRAALNKFVPRETRQRAKRLTIYIGDGPTDFHVFDGVRDDYGKAILVYKEENKERAKAILEMGRVDAIAPANYLPGSDLDKIVKDFMRELIAKDRAIELKKAAEKLPALAFDLKSSELMRRASSISKKLNDFAEQEAASGRKVEVLSH